MNLRRGVLRLWLVLSLCWIVGVGVFLGGTNKLWRLAIRP